LTILIFLLPLVALYEYGAARYLAGDETRPVETIRAHRLLHEFFDAFGVSGLYLPGVALVVVLLVWHLLRRDRWRVRPAALGGMLLESIAWTIPLLVLGQMVGRAVQAPLGDVAALALAAPQAGIAALEWPARATIAIGAGLYEELLFRFVAIGGLHFVAVDLLGLKDATGKVVAVVASAAAFALYHDVVLADAPGLLQAGFFFLAGCYFGLVFVLRGFGVVVGVHTLYDLVVLL
jgi:membrane protease YdiL (CAAX protease family)